MKSTEHCNQTFVSHWAQQDGFSFSVAKIQCVCFACLQVCISPPICSLTTAFCYLLQPGPGVENRQWCCNFRVPDFALGWFTEPSLWLHDEDHTIHPWSCPCIVIYLAIGTFHTIWLEIFIWRTTTHMHYILQLLDQWLCTCMASFSNFICACCILFPLDSPVPLWLITILWPSTCQMWEVNYLLLCIADILPDSSTYWGVWLY